MVHCVAFTSLCKAVEQPIRLEWYSVGLHCNVVSHGITFLHSFIVHASPSDDIESGYCVFIILGSWASHKRVVSEGIRLGIWVHPLHMLHHCQDRLICLWCSRTVILVFKLPCCAQERIFMKPDLKRNVFCTQRPWGSAIFCCRLFYPTQMELCLHAYVKSR